MESILINPIYIEAIFPCKNSKTDLVVRLVSGKQFYASTEQIARALDYIGCEWALLPGEPSMI